MAREAGVSVGTVSHVVSGARGVRPATRQRVESAMEQLGYRPNRVARSLRSNSTKTAAVAVHDLTSPFHTEILRGAEDVLNQLGYSVLIGNSAADAGRAGRNLEAFVEQRVDGTILTTFVAGLEREVAALGDQGPMVLVGAHPSAWAGDAVTPGREAGDLVARHLIELGHTRIAMINGGPGGPAADERRRTFAAALRAAGLAPLAMSSGEFTVASGRAQAHALLRAARTRPTAIFAAADVLALGAISAAHQLGLDVPGDVSVAGYDDIPMADLLHPSLTTVRQPAYHMGAAAARLLVQRLAGDDSPVQRITLEPYLVARASTAPPRPEDRDGADTRS